MSAEANTGPSPGENEKSNEELREALSAAEIERLREALTITIKKLSNEDEHGQPIPDGDADALMRAAERASDETVAMIGDFLNDKGITPDHPLYDSLHDELINISPIHMGDTEWQQAQPASGPDDEGRPSGKDRWEAFRDEKLSSTADKGDDDKEKGDATESKKGHEDLLAGAECLKPENVEVLRQMQRDRYGSKTESIPPHDIDQLSKAWDEAVNEFPAIIEEYMNRHGVSSDDPELHNRIAKELRGLSIDTMEETPWLVGEVDEEGNRSASGRQQAGERQAEFNREAEAAKSPEAPEKETPPKPDRMTDEQYNELIDRIDEVWLETEQAANELADMTAAIMKGKLSPDDESYKQKYEEYNQLSLKYNTLLMQSKREDIAGKLDEEETLTEDERKEREAELLKAEAVKAVVAMQGDLRGRVREAYLSNVWRQGVAFGAKFWNHEKALVKWGTRIGIGTAVSLPLLATMGGFGGLLAATGAAKGFVMGVGTKFLGASSKGPGVNAEKDFNFKEDAADFTQRIDQILKEASATAQSAMVTEAGVERGKREQATNLKNLGKAGLIGAGVGGTIGTLINIGQAVWNLPGDFSDFSHRMGNAPAHGAGGHATASPGSDHVPTSSGVEHSSGTGSGGNNLTNGVDGHGHQTSGTGHGGLNPDGSKVTPGSSGGQHATGGSRHSTGGGSGGEGNGGGSGSSDNFRMKGVDQNRNWPGLEDHSGGNGGTDHVTSDSSVTPEVSDAAQTITLNEGPYATFEQMHIPQGMWEGLYRNEDLMNELIKNGDAYPLTEQGYGFGWSHTGSMNPNSIEAIYRHARISSR